MEDEMELDVDGLDPNYDIGCVVPIVRFNVKLYDRGTKQYEDVIESSVFSIDDIDGLDPIISDIDLRFVTCVDICCGNKNHTNARQTITNDSYFKFQSVKDDSRYTLLCEESEIFPVFIKDIGDDKTDDPNFVDFFKDLAVWVKEINNNAHFFNRAEDERERELHYNQLAFARSMCVLLSRVYFEATGNRFYVRSTIHEDNVVLELSDRLHDNIPSMLLSDFLISNNYGLVSYVISNCSYKW